MTTEQTSGRPGGAVAEVKGKGEELVSSTQEQLSTLELVKDLTHQASTLVHQEVELVTLEVRENFELAKL